MPSGVPRIPAPCEWQRTKHCACCGADKPWALFSPKVYWPDGSVRNVQSWCRSCKQTNERYRLSQRAWRRRNRRRLNDKKRAWRRQRDAAIRAERNSDMWLPIGPFLSWLLERSQELGGWAALADCIGMHERQLHRFRTGEQQQVRLAEVDRCAVALGFHLADIVELP